MAFSQKGKGRFSITFPKDELRSRSQTEEYCIFERGGRRQTIRFHDYSKIYSIPGLYEYLFCKKLRYKSPEVVTGLLVKEVLRSSSSGQFSLFNHSIDGKQDDSSEQAGRADD